MTNHLSAAVIPCEPCVGRRVNSPSGSSGLDNQANGSTPFYIYIYIYVRTLRASVHIQVTMGIVSVYKGEKLGVMYKGELTLRLGSFRMAAN